MPLNPVRRTLDNGVVVIAKENHTTPAVTLLAIVRAGGYDDPAGRDGTAALVARVLDRGTGTRSADVIADDLDGRGASLSVSAGRHQIGVAAACLVEDLSPVMQIAADVLRAPAFPDADVETRRAEILTTIRQDDDDPASVAVNQFMSDVYDAHPYARRVRGTIETVQSLRRADLASFHARWFTPAALTVVIVGSLPAAAWSSRSPPRSATGRGTGRAAPSRSPTPPIRPRAGCSASRCPRRRRPTSRTGSSASGVSTRATWPPR